MRNRKNKIHTRRKRKSRKSSRKSKAKSKSRKSSRRAKSSRKAKSKSRKAKSKSRKAKSKSRKSSRKAKSRKSRKSKSKSRKAKSKSRKSSRKAKSRKSRKAKSKSRKSSRKSRKSRKAKSRRKSRKSKRKSSKSRRKSKNKAYTDNNFYNLESRLAKMQILNKELKPMQKYSYGKQCVNSERAKKYLSMGKLLGVGGFGNVYTACAPVPCNNKSIKFGLKLMGLDEYSYKNKYDKFHMDWNEYLMLKKYVNKLVISGHGPNLPLMVDEMICGNCSFKKRNKNLFGPKYINFDTPCITIVSELAFSDLAYFLKSVKADDILYVLLALLFQIMAGLYSLQKTFQIVNNDLKAGNVLVYKVKRGGFFNYNIQGIDYYIPNFGFMFVINDFGLSTCYSPHTSFNGPIMDTIYNQPKNIISLGTRPGIVNEGIFVPLNAKVSYSIRTVKEIFYDNLDYKPIFKYRLERNNPVDVVWTATEAVDGFIYPSLKSSAAGIFKNNYGDIYDPEIRLGRVAKGVLVSKGIPLDPTNPAFYDDASVVPPIEFMNDTQDALRIFLGGGQMAVSNFHYEFHSIRNLMEKYLKPYNINLREQKLSNRFVDYPQAASSCSAACFIYDFFGPGYTSKPKSPLCFTKEVRQGIVAEYNL